MNRIYRTIFILAFSMLLFEGCTVQHTSRNRYKQSTKRYHRSCGCYLIQPQRTDSSQIIFADGK